MTCEDANAEELEYYDYGDEEDLAADGGDEQDASESYSPAGPPPLPDIVGDRFRMGKQVGSGSYSEVYGGVDNVSGNKVAIKVEWQRAEKGDKLLAEAKLIRESLEGGKAGAEGVLPQLHWSGSPGEYNIMVMDLLGPSVEDFRKKREKFSLDTVAMLAWQMIDRLRYVHSRGVIYRDCKPHNFLMGIGDNRGRVYVVDFGLAKVYRDPRTRKHIACTKKRGVTGTVRYSSRNVHAGLEAGRRDDLESMGYIFLHFLRGSLPWQGLKGGSKRTKHEKIHQCKLRTSDEELCKGLPREFVLYFEHCRSLKFADEPDYAYLQRLMADVLKERGGSHESQRFDWTVDGADGDAGSFEGRGDRDRRRRSKGSKDCDRGPAPEERPRSGGAVGSGPGASADGAASARSRSRRRASAG